MTSTASRTRALRLAFVAAAAIGLGACSKNNGDVAPPNAAASMPATVALAPASAPLPATSAPLAPPVVVAQNESRDNSAYEAGRQDQRRLDARRADQARQARQHAEQRQLPPRADRDTDVRHDQRVAAAACPECGVVESVTEVKVQGQTNGVGALAGGATGALVGNRIAGGNNRTLGAADGGREGARRVRRAAPALVTPALRRAFARSSRRVAPPPAWILRRRFAPRRMTGLAAALSGRSRPPAPASAPPGSSCRSAAPARRRRSGARTGAPSPPGRRP